MSYFSSIPVVLFFAATVAADDLISQTTRERLWSRYANDFRYVPEAGWNAADLLTGFALTVAGRTAGRAVLKTRGGVTA